MDPARQMRVADDFVRRLAAAIRGAQLYSQGHPIVKRALDALAESCSQLLVDQSSLAVGIVGTDIVVGEVPIPRSRESFGELTRRLKRLGIERIAFERGVTPEEITAVLQLTATLGLHTMSLAAPILVEEMENHRRGEFSDVSEG